MILENVIIIHIALFFKSSVINVGKTGTMRPCGARNTRIYFRKIKKDKKTFIWPTAATSNKTNWHEKMGNTASLDFQVIIVIVFCIFFIKLEQYKNVMQKNIMQVLHSEIARYKCKYWPSCIS